MDSVFSSLYVVLLVAITIKTNPTSHPNENYLSDVMFKALHLFFRHCTDLHSSAHKVYNNLSILKCVFLF